MSRKFQAKLIFGVLPERHHPLRSPEDDKPIVALIFSVSSCGKDVCSEPSSFNCTSNPHNDMDISFSLLLLS